MATTAVSAPWIRPLRHDMLTQLDGSLHNLAARGKELSGDELLVIGDQLLAGVFALRASDLHLTPYSDRVVIRVRIDGALLDIFQLPLPAGLQLIRHLKVMAGLDTGPLFRPLEARQTRRIGDLNVDLRLACSPCVTGEKLAIRLLNPQMLKRTIEDLGLCAPERQPIDQWLAESSGMLLATGPTGSGKTTTLCALLHELRLIDRSVMTIEDPVEYQIDGVAQMQINEKQGLTFAQGLRAMLRLDADYLMVGEIRDVDTAQAAMEASTTGRVLMSTLHSRDAFGAVTALRNWDLADYEIATCLEMVIAQRLVRKLCPHCRRLSPPSEAISHWLTALGLPTPKRTWNAVGCEECRRLGYFGRTGVFEVWRLNEEAYQLIVNHVDEHKLREYQLAAGHRPLIVDGLAMAADGIISLEELRGLGSFFLPRPNTPAAVAMQETLGDQ